MQHDEHVKTSMRLLAAMTALAAVSLGFASAAQADDYSTLNATELEQTVLRAQMPKTLGSWTQNYYYSEADPRYNRPTQCWNASGDVQLPTAKNMGAVGYAVGSNGSGVVTVYQYADAAKAEAALTAMKSARCSDNPVVMTDEGKKVKAQSGSDFTDDSLTGYAAGLSYPQDDKIIFTDIRTTQRGLAVVQTEVMRWIDASASITQQQNTASRLGSVNGKWHAAAVKAYENFGQGSAR